MNKLYLLAILSLPLILFTLFFFFFLKKFSEKEKPIPLDAAWMDAWQEVEDILNPKTEEELAVEIEVETMREEVGEPCVVSA